jgi:hypothetical protein
MRKGPVRSYIDRDSDEVWYDGREGRGQDITVEGPTRYRVGFLQFPERDEPKAEPLFDRWRDYREERRRR